MKDVLGLIYSHKTSTFQDKDSFISIFMRNIQNLANEMCKVANDTSLEVMEEVFNFRREIDKT